jgi:hypothetical protein
MLSLGCVCYMSQHTVRREICSQIKFVPAKVFGDTYR